MKIVDFHDILTKIEQILHKIVDFMQYLMEFDDETPIYWCFIIDVWKINK